MDNLKIKLFYYTSNAKKTLKSAVENKSKKKNQELTECEAKLTPQEYDRKLKRAYIN